MLKKLARDKILKLIAKICKLRTKKVSWHWAQIGWNIMRVFCLVNSLVVNRNLWLISFGKIWLFLIFVKHTSKIVRIPYLCLFFSSFSTCWVFNNFVIFHLINVAKHYSNPCCHLAAETGSWFVLIKVRFSQKWSPKKPAKNLALKAKCKSRPEHSGSVVCSVKLWWEM